MEALAEVLVDSGIACGSKAALLEAGVPERFMPHGLGHLLGIQVHDAGGQLANAEGDLTPPPANHPALRLTRTLTPEMVVTVEPGLYFIPSFLKALREGRTRELLNWPLIETLTPFGGIRIEDNVRITPEGPENLTRDAFAGAATP
jgi:Xaa-Pro dipeptidase